MKKNTRIIIFSLIGLGVLAAVVALLYFTQPSPTADGEETSAEETTVDESLVFNDYTEEEIVSIQAENRHGGFSMTRTQNDDGTSRWMLDEVEIDADRYNATIFETVEGYAAGLTVKELVEADADLSKYGLDDPSAVVTVTNADGEASVFLLGDEAPAGSYTYIARENSKDVYINYTYKVNSFFTYSSLDFVDTAVIEEYNSAQAETVQKITVKRKDLEEDIVLEALPELPEDSDSIAVFSHAFTSPYDVYLDLNAANEYIYAMYGLSAEKAAYLGVTDETKALTGLDDPFCEVAMLVGDTVYRLYIGDPIEETVTDEVSGVTTTEITGYYGYCNKVPDIIYVFSPDAVFWAEMKAEDYISKLFLMPYIYDLTEVSYKDAQTSFAVTIEGNNEENAFYLADGTEADGDLFRSLYEFMINARGEEIYTGEEKGELLAEFIYKYEDETREDSVIRFYGAADERSVVININGENLYKTRPLYVTRLQENAKAFLEGGEIVLTY